jgi:murein DD-endopeptidase MepM/ murein hydrolase activator NlpD
MKILFGLIFLTSSIAGCVLMCITSLYAAGALAAAQTVRSIPFIGPHVSDRIAAWVMGAEEEMVADDAPAFAIGTPIAAEQTPLPVTPMPHNPDCGIPYIFPVDGPITSYFGWRSNIADPSKREFHAGIDLSSPSGTAVKATMCGQVTEAGWSNLYGWVVSVSNGNITTLYGHNSALRVTVGDWVEKGQVLAESGNTGRSTGPHVHYGISIDGTWVDPVEAFGIG